MSRSSRLSRLGEVDKAKSLNASTFMLANRSPHKLGLDKTRIKLLASFNPDNRGLRSSLVLCVGFGGTMPHKSLLLVHEILLLE